MVFGRSSNERAFNWYLLVEIDAEDLSHCLLREISPCFEDPFLCDCNGRLELDNLFLGREIKFVAIFRCFSYAALAC